MESADHGSLLGFEPRGEVGGGGQGGTSRRGEMHEQNRGSCGIQEHPLQVCPGGLKPGETNGPLLKD